MQNMSFEGTKRYFRNTTPLSKIIVLCDFTASVILGHYFLRIYGQLILYCVTAQRNLHMMQAFVVPQQCSKDSALAPSDIGRKVKYFLRQHFSDGRVISRYFRVAWPLPQWCNCKRTECKRCK